MKRTTFVLICLLNMLVHAKAQSNYDSRVRNYIDQYKDWAIAEQRRSGVPASITLAQGIHETSAGNSELALNANNHFGIKCKKEWTGETYAYTDDAPNECFRKYSSALQSYKDHSDYLKSSKRYESLFGLSCMDYAGWAIGLKKCGYATNPKYAQILIKLIENYQLQEFTAAALNDNSTPSQKNIQPQSFNKKTTGEVVPEEDAKPALNRTSSEIPPTPNTSSKRSSLIGSNPSSGHGPNAPSEEDFGDDPQTPEYGTLVNVNGLKAFYAKKGTVLLEDAFRFGIRYAKLLEINELPDLPLEADMYVYLEKKSTKGIHATHLVQPGETLTQIAQTEAIQLKYLKYYNRINSNEEPEPGAILQLQQFAESKPPTIVKNISKRNEGTSFVGSTPQAIPQGSSRMRVGYVTKAQIAEAETKPITSESSKTKTEEKQFAGKATSTEIENANPKKVLNTVDSLKIKPQETLAKTENIEQTTISKMPDTVQPESIKPLLDSVSKPTLVKVEPQTDKEMPVTPMILTDTVMVKKSEQVDHTSIIKVVTKDSAVNEKIFPVEPNEPANIKTSLDDEQKEKEIVKTQTELLHSEKNANSATQNDDIGRNEVQTVKVGDSVAYEISQPSPIIETKSDHSSESEQTLPKSEVISSIHGSRAQVRAIQPTVSTPSKVEVSVVPDEPKDEYARLKAKLDKVVYATNETVSEPQTQASKPATEKKSASTSTGKMYTVKKGETAFAIAKKHGITMKQLREWNSLDFKEVKAGQQLRVKP
ncbi:MAG: glucosaminidase domain-containing protein [Bacteroidetes bacterium]|nr:glucosaminidase domain-containing protein [Bacteroidota bacterium]